MSAKSRDLKLPYTRILTLFLISLLIVHTYVAEINPYSILIFIILVINWQNIIMIANMYVGKITNSYSCD